jgi:hypothetical protein
MLRRPGHWRKAFDALNHARDFSQKKSEFGTPFAAVRSQDMTTLDENETESREPRLKPVDGERLHDAISVSPNLGPPERNAYLLEAAERLSAALFQVVHQPTSKGRDRSLAALIALIYGPTPFGGVNSLRDVAMRYGMSEQNLFQLMRVHRDLLARAAEPEYEI